MAFMLSRFLSRIGEIIGKDIDQLFDHVERGGEAYIRHRMIMNLPIIGHSHVSHDRFAVNFNLIGRADNDMVTFVIRFTYGFGFWMLVFLNLPDLRGMLLHIGTYRFQCRPRDGILAWHGSPLQKIRSS